MSESAPSYDPQDDLRQKLAQAGLLDHQIDAIAPRVKLGDQWMQPNMAQGRSVGPHNAYVASSWLEHLSNAFRQVMGGKIAGDAEAQQMGLIKKAGEARAAYMKAQQAGMSPDGQRNLEMMGAASGDPAMTEAAKFGQQGRHLDLQTAQMLDLMRHRGVLEDQGQQRADQGDARVEAMQKALALKGVRWNPNSGEFENITGKARPSLLPRSTGGGTPPPAAPPPLPGGAPPPPTQPAQAPLGKWQDKALKELGADFNPSSGRAGEFGKNQQRVNAAKRVMALAVDENGNARDLNPQQMPELAQSVAALIGGSSTAQAQIEHLLPKSYSRDAAGLLQYFTNEPHGAGQQAFVQNMVDTAKREQAVAQQGIDQVRGSLAMKHQRILRSNPNEARNVLKGFGWDLGPDGMPVQQQTQQAGPGADTAALRKKYGL